MRKSCFLWKQPEVDLSAEQKGCKQCKTLFMRSSVTANKKLWLDSRFTTTSSKFDFMCKQITSAWTSFEEPPNCFAETQLITLLHFSRILFPRHLQDWSGRRTWGVRTRGQRSLQTLVWMKEKPSSCLHMWDGIGKGWETTRAHSVEAGCGSWNPKDWPWAQARLG